MCYWSHLLIAAIPYRAVDRAYTSVIWWCIILWLAFFGGAVGSFLTVVWDRMGTGEGFVLPRSRCPECDRPIRWYHNVPVVGWLLLRGRCYDCGSRIPVKHPLIELAFAIAFVFIGLAAIRAISSRHSANYLRSSLTVNKCLSEGGFAAEGSCPWVSQDSSLRSAPLRMTLERHDCRNLG